MIAIGAITAAQAQSSRSYPDRYESKDVILGSKNDRYDRNDRNNRTYGNNNSRYTYSFSAKERDKAIDWIDRDYDKRIRQVERERNYRFYEKNAQMRRLQEQKRQDVAQVWERFRSSNNLHRDNSYQKNNRRW